MVDIFYKSYRKDFKLLKYSLESIKKNVEGYNNIIILIPERDRELFDTRDMPERTLIHYVDEYGNGYLFQQWCKVSAYNYSSSEYILFADSDCIFDHKINVNDYIIEGKPEILHTDYSKVGDAICWREPTERFIKQPLQFEFMRRNCLIYHRTTLVALSKFDSKLEDKIMISNRFSEFNAIGAFAYVYENDKYRFTNTDEWQYVRPLAIQLWSWCESGNDEVHKYERKRALDTINETLELNLTEL